ncbi:MAG: patatin-like phospholipase family protein, partial [Deltaproteobacteria bacterium]
NTPMESFKIPFYAIATNAKTGKQIVFGQGDAGMAVRASCSIPGIFRPVIINGETYVDGGLISPIGVREAKAYGADIIIAVDLSNADNTIPQTTVESILKAIGIMYAEISENLRLQADIVIRPNVGYISSSDFSRKSEAILEGERATQTMIPAIYKTIQNYK